MNRMEGKVAVVTGGAHGIGRAVAKLFAESGARVAIADRRQGRSEQVVAEILATNGQAIFQDLDVGSETRVRAVFDRVATELGRIDILVNAVSMVGPSGASCDVSEDQWDEVMAFNVRGSMFCTKQVIPYLRHAKGGAIVNVSSIYGAIGSNSVAAYHASQGALRTLTKCDAVAYAKDNIRVNAVLAGFVWMPLDDDLSGESGIGRGVADSVIESSTPLGRAGSPEEVAQAIRFLASDEASFITGTELIVDGGYTAR